MKCNTTFARSRLSCLLTIGISFFTLFHPLELVGQNKLAAYSQLQTMKQHYQQWLAGRPASDLFVEFDPVPVALDKPKPRFSWILNLEGRGRKQSAYQILVASNRKILDEDEGDIWNSGLVASAQSAQVSYKGVPLVSNKAYFWKLRIKDETGKIYPYGKTGTFNTGLFSEEEWTAVWIGKGDANEVFPDVDSFLTKKLSKEVQKVIPDSRSPLFRKEFRIEKKVRRARVFVAGLGLYELRLNGKKVGNSVLAPARTDFRNRVLYDTYDVSAELNTGLNALGIMLGNGWFNGQKKYWGWQHQWYGSPRVILQLEIEYADGSKSSVMTDGNWKSSWSPITFNCLYDRGHYDAQLEEKKAHRK